MSGISVPSLLVSDAARRLGVSEQRVRAMISAGAIDAQKAGGAWWIPAESLALAVALSRRAGRPFSPESAWSLLLIASGESAAWASPKVRWRASVALKEKGLAESFGKLGNRAVRHAFQAHPAELLRLAGRKELMLGGVSAAADYRLGLQGGDEVEAYVSAGAIEHVAQRHGLVRGSEANVILRAIPEEMWLVLRRPVAPIAAVLADLAEHTDPRARRVGHEWAVRLGSDRTANG
jgi:Helix-turn-helix domain